jgi:hypothetical protein
VRLSEVQPESLQAPKNVLHRHLATSDAIYFSSNVAGVITCEENEDLGDLGGVSGSPEDSLRAELFHLFLGHSRGNKRCPDGTGATALTRTPCLIARLASDRVKLTMAALVEA